MKLKHATVEVPKTMRSLPLTDKGYLKPWFVKADDFRVVDDSKAEIANAKKACWICGKPFTEQSFALVCSPISAMTRIFREPPSHKECAEYAMKVCPFILYPNSKRRTSGLPEEATLDYINRDLEVKQGEENPGEYYLVVVQDFYLDKDTRTIRCHESQVVERQHWVEGVKLQGHPTPIVPYHDAPQELRNQLSEEQYLNEFGPKNSQAVSKSGGFEPVVHSTFANKLWIKPTTYRFGYEDKIVAMGATEAIEAMHTLPLAFVREKNNITLVAVLGLTGDRNLLVDGDGNWKHGHVPYVYSCFPFRLGKTATGEVILLADPQSELIVDSNTPADSKSPATSIFNDEGTLTPELQDVEHHLKKLDRDIAKALELAVLLDKIGLIEPWPLKLVGASDAETVTLQGLFRVSEQSLNGLAAEDLAELRDSGALLIAYCQLLSMSNLKYLTS